MALQTQWRVIVGGMSRPVWQGLDYTPVPSVLDIIGVAPADRDEVFAGLRIMESAAIPERNKTSE